MKNTGRSTRHIAASLALAALALLMIGTPILAAQGMQSMKAQNQRAESPILQKPPVQKPVPPQLLAEAKMSDGIKMKARAGKQEMVDVIVQYNSPPGNFELSRSASLGAQSKRDYQHFRMKALKVPAQALHGLAKGNRVQFVSLDVPVETSSLAAKQTANLPGAGTNQILVPSQSIAVAVLDSGIDHGDVYTSRRINIIPSYYDCDACEEASARSGRKKRSLGPRHPRRRHHQWSRWVL